MASRMLRVSVILPTYNEKENIEGLIASILENLMYPTEVIVVDDDSPDGTGKIVEKIARDNRNVRLLIRENKRGLASAISEGIPLSKGEIIVWMDCDFSHPPRLMPQLIQALDQCDIAVASRFVKGGGMQYSFLRVLTSRLLNLFANIILGFSIKDYTSGYPAVRREVFDKVKIQPLLGENRGYIVGYGEYFISFLYRAKKAGFKIKEVPYTYVARKKGNTKTSPNIFALLKYGIVYGLAILYLRLKYP
jgi:dolichol-phosphate mannosyltransferase